MKLITLTNWEMVSLLMSYLQCHPKVTGHPYLPHVNIQFSVVSCQSSYRGTFEISDEPENTDVCQRMVVHEFVLFETQPIQVPPC